MRRSVISVFDEFIPDATALYTGAQWNEALGTYDKIAIQAIADQVASTPTLTVVIEHSNDQRNWATRSTPIAVTLTSGTNNLVGTDNGSTPGLAYARLKISLSGNSAHLKVIVCLRDDA